MLAPYESYQESQSPFSRTIPAHWEEKRLSWIFSTRSVQNCANEELLSVFLDKGVVSYSSTSQKQVHKPSDDMSKYQLVEPGDFVLNNQQAWRGSVGISRYRGIVSPAYIVLRPRINVNQSFLNYMVRDSSIIDQFVLASKGVGSIQRQIYIPYMKRTVFALPPLYEQDQIVRFLDWKTTEIARFVKGKKKEIAYLTELKNSLIFHAVTKGCRPTATKMCQQKWIGDIPAHWEEKMLFQCATEQNISNKNVHNQNLLSLSYGKIVNKDINTTTGLLPASFDTYQIIHDGNIILRLTDLQNDHKSLRVGLSTQTGIITSAYTCLKPRAHVLPEYLYLLLHSYDVSKLFYGMGGGVRQSIGYNDIRRVIVLLPPKEEQEEIVTYCHGVQTKIDLLIDSIKNEISYLGELRTRTIADVVTGKVDVRGVIIPEYEMTTYDEIDEDINEDTTDESEEETLDEEVDD